MRKIVLTLLVTLAGACTAMAATISSKAPTLKDGCYQIGTAEELFGFADISARRSYDNPQMLCAKLTADIVVNKNVLDPSGRLNDKTEDLVPWNPIKNFAGIFDGNGHVISGLYVNDTTLQNVGFIGENFEASNTDTTIISNLGIVDSYIKGYKSRYSSDTYIGGILGVATPLRNYVKISHCYNQATIEGDSFIGGLVGKAFGKMVIEDSYNTGRINSTRSHEYIGGLIGETVNDTLFISNSYNSGNISNGGFVGGLVGKVNNVQIINSYNTGNLSSEYYGVSGLVNSITGFDRLPRTPEYSQIINSYNTGTLISNHDVGGLVGGIVKAELNIINCYSDGDLTRERIDYRDFALVTNVSNSEVNIVNSFFTLQTYDTKTALKLVYSCNESSTCNIDNSFALSNSASNEQSVTSKDLEDGSIALKLHNYKKNDIDGSVWGENVGVDIHPVFSGNVDFNTVEAKIEPKIPPQIDGCYQIGNADELYGFAAVVKGTDSTEAKLDACGKLTADIVINERLLINGGFVNERGRRLAEWPSINDFEGIFDGQNHSISGLYINQPRSDTVGFFNHVGKQSVTNKIEIKNIQFKDSYIGGRKVGGFVGKLHSSIEISNSTIEGLLEGEQISGFIQHASEYTSSSKEKELISIKNCHNKADIKLRYNTSGFIGYVDHYKKVVIENSSNTSKVLQDSARYSPNANGFIMSADRANISIINSYNANTLTEHTHYNGFIGYFSLPYHNEKVYIVNSYDVGDLSKKFVFNGFISNQPDRDYLIVEHSYFRTDSTNHFEGFSATKEDFANGIIAAELHNYNNNSIDGSVWGQEIGRDPSPTLSGTISNYTPTVSKLILHTYEGDTTKYADYYVEGHKFYVPKPKRKGYIFAGWYDNKNLEGDAVLAITSTQKGDVNLYAKWFEMKPLELKGNCFEIGNAEGLYQFAHYVNDTTRTNLNDALCAKLTADIVVNKNVLTSPETINEEASNFIKWEPIENFHGTFDGQGHFISGIYFYDTRYYAGLFSSFNSLKYDVWKGEDTTFVKNLTLKDSYIETTESAAGIVGKIGNQVSIFDNIHNEALVKGKMYIGGLAARIESYGYPIILNSSNKGNIHAISGYVAGLVAYSLNGTRISNSYNSGNISGNFSVGGLGGYVSGDLMDDDHGLSLIEFSYNVGDLSGEESVGGLFGGCDPCNVHQSANLGKVSGYFQIGGLFASFSGNLYNSYNSGIIESDNVHGGLIGHASVATVTNSFNTQSIITGSYKRGGIIGDSDQWLEQKVTNSFFINTDKENLFQETPVTEKDFTDGTVLRYLQEYKDSVIDGTCWIQSIGKDKHPVLKGMNIVTISSSSVIKSSSSNATSLSSSSNGAKSSSSQTSSSSGVSSSRENSSSSNIASSSSQKKNSSSSEARSSSGQITSSSSKPVISSSSAQKTSSSSSVSSSSKKTSSSSSKKASSSSSERKNLLESPALANRYNLTIDRRNILISGMSAQLPVALFDLNGNLVDKSVTNINGATLWAPRPGRYIVRIGSQIHPVTAK